MQIMHIMYKTNLYITFLNKDTFCTSQWINVRLIPIAVYRLPTHSEDQAHAQEDHKMQNYNNFSASLFLLSLPKYN